MKFSVSGTLASMACGLPYAIAAQIAFPERQSVAFVGDGGLTMLMGEFATAVQYNLPIKIIVIKNNILGMIRWEQMGFLGNPEFGVEFSPIDFAKFAEVCGGKGYSINEPSEEITNLLRAWNGGDEAALGRLAEHVYPELRLIARRYMKNERQGATLQTTALVHEVYLRLVDEIGRAHV